jgi:hypothetical protein
MTLITTLSTVTLSKYCKHVSRAACRVRPMHLVPCKSCSIKMIDSDIVDTSIWPCFTPGMHWALSDEVRRIGRLCSVDSDNDTVEYEINVDRLPDGETGLWHFNALRNISVGLDDWPSNIRRLVVGSTLCLGPKALQTVDHTEKHADIEFDMFTGDSILPLFVVDEAILTLRVHFRSLNSSVTNCLPKYAGTAQGLLCKFKCRDRAFFVAGSRQSVLSWDGHQSHVFQTASMDQRPNCNSDDDGEILEGHSDGRVHREGLTEEQKSVVRNEDSTYSDLISALPLGHDGCHDSCHDDDGICGSDSAHGPKKRYFNEEDFSLMTPRPV